VPPLAPLVVAHRGSSATYAEHTLTAYVRALDEGADALECDVRLTADGQLVCVHDRKVNRTSDGRGIVSELELADLTELDFASWHEGALEAPDLDESRRVLTLERLLQLVRDHDRPVRMLIETKHPNRWAGLVEQTLVRLLDQYGMSKPPDPEHAVATVMSFNPVALRRMRLLRPQVPRVLLLNKVLPFRRDGSLPQGVRIAGPSVRIVRSHPEYVSKLRARGNQVYCWTVDDPDDIAAVLRTGVDAVITNRPTDVLRALGRA
jgi:glycerophosphoryl diester phosphodiesterase